MIIKLRDTQYGDYEIHSKVVSYHKIDGNILVINYNNGKWCTKNMNYWEISEIINDEAK